MGEFVVAQKSIIIYNRKVLLMKKSAKTWDNANIWEFVGGCLEFGETLPEGLAREIREETGLIVDVDRLLYATTHIPTRPEQKKQFVFLVYLSYADSGKVILSEEHKDYLWATREQIVELLDESWMSDLRCNKVLDTIVLD